MVASWFVALSPRINVSRAVFKKWAKVTQVYGSVIAIDVLVCIYSCILHRISPGELIGATSWTAIAARAANGSVVQVQINPRTGLDVFIDGIKQDFEDLSTQEFARKCQIPTI